MSYKAKILSKYAQLEAENASLIKEIEKLEESQLNYKSSPEKWCIIQVLNHLKNTEVGTLSYIQKKIKYGGLQNVNWSAGIRAFLMRSVNNSSIKFKMPSVLTPPSSDGTLDNIQIEWRDLRAEWKEFIEHFPMEYLDKAVFRHPIFGRLSFMQTMDSMISHQNHHRKQIRRIKNAVTLEKNK